MYLELRVTWTGVLNTLDQQKWSRFKVLQFLITRKGRENVMQMVKRILA
jgi:hypothetical protein